VLVDRASRRSMPWPEHTIAALGALVPVGPAVELDARVSSMPQQGVLAR
jgi:hypothetical protein